MNNNPTITPQVVPSPFHNFCMSIGAIPTSYKDTLDYYETLLWLIKFLDTQVLPALNTNGEAVAELQGLYIQLKDFVDNYFDNLDVQEEINNKLDTMVEDGTLDSIISNYISNDFINKVNGYMNPVELGGFVAILNSSSTGALKTDTQINKNISDLVDAKVPYYNLICEVMPNSTDKAGYEGGTLSIDDITFSCYPDIETLNHYIDYSKEQGIELYTLKFHSVWAKNNLSDSDYVTFISKYGNVVTTILSALNNKPKYATIFNEFYSLFNISTISSITTLLSSIQETGVKVGLCGIINELITYNLGDNVDAIFPHFYPYATMKGSDSTIQDVYEGIERSKTGEKIILRLHQLYPDKDVIISEVGASSYWEALAQPERYWGNIAGATIDSNGMPMALYARGALRYYSQFNIKGLFIFWTDTVPKYLKEFYLDYFERGDM